MTNEEVCKQCGDIIDEPLTCAACGLRGCEGCIDWCCDDDDEMNGDYFCESCQMRAI